MRVKPEAGDAVAVDERGDAEADPLAGLYRLYERRLFRQCLTHLRNRSDAEDAVQETFVRAARHLEQLEDDPAPYLATVARNVCRDEVQRRARCICTEDPALFGEITVGHPETSTIDRDEINAAWRRFSRRERQLVGGRFAGFSYEEIAAQFGMTTGALTMALARARRRARQVASVGLSVLVGALSLRRLLLRGARSGGASVAAPSLVAVSVLTCAVVGAVGGTWLLTQPGRAPITIAPSSLSGSARPGGASTAGASLSGASAEHGGSTAAGSVAPSGDGSHASLNGVANSVLSPGSNATQQDAAFSSITPSPSYQRDRTVFASGSLANGCGRPTCPVLFRTTDGGATWQHLTASGFLGGRILLSPAFPTDPVIFAAGPAGLQRSDDGGATFRTVVPGPAPAAVDPRSVAGDARVFIAAQVPLIYDAAAGRAVQATLLPVGIAPPTDVVYAANGDVVMAANQIDTTSATAQDGVVVACPGGSSCHVTLVDPTQPLLNLLSVPQAGGTTVFAWSSRGIRVSHDDGSTFASLAVPATDQVQSVAAGAATLLVAEQASGGTVAQLLQSTNGGASFARVVPVGLAQDVVSGIVVLPDGRELAAATASTQTHGFGILCSADAGATWAPSC